MTQKIAGAGVGLPLPQFYFPSQLNYAAPDQPSNEVGLAPADAIPIPAGEWIIDLGQYCVLQQLDPITGTWKLACAAGWQGGNVQTVVSDGTNYRAANLLGCPVGAAITAAGAGMAQATTTITPTPNNGSTWLPVIGGALTANVTGNGAGYGVAPLVLIPPPPPAATNPNGVGGIPATAFAVIGSGTVSTVSFTHPGAGYPSAPTAVVVPSPFDPNINVGITNATVVLSLTGAGSLTGVLCTNHGGTLANPANFTLTVGGGGTVGTLSPAVLQRITVASVTGAAAGGFGTSVQLTTAGGGWPAGSLTNTPEFLQLRFRPRPAQVTLTTTAGTIVTQNGTIVDGGLFASTPQPVVITNLTGSVAAGTLALTMGNSADFVRLQPAA